MSEADWWLCGQCQSLNNLSARECYSCRKRKPRDAVRASEFLGYVPVETWNGKVTLLTVVPPSGLERPVLPLPPPLREPVLRDTVAVAPRPPDGARITYRVSLPLAPVRGPQMPPTELRSTTAPLLPNRPASSFLLGGSANPSQLERLPLEEVGPGPAPGPTPAPDAPRAEVPAPPVRVGPGPAPGPTPAPDAPRAEVPLFPPSVGPGPASDPTPAPDRPAAEVPAPPVVGQTQEWPHWRDLLDGPTPEGARLRAAYSPDADVPSGRGQAAGPRDQHALSQAIKSAGHGSTGEARPDIPWPQADQADTESRTDADDAGLDQRGILRPEPTT